MFSKWMVFLLGLFAMAQAQADEHIFDTHQKNYLSSDCVRIENEAIFVFLNSQWVKAPSLYSDSHGIYVDEIKLFPWYCSNCNRWTTGWFCCEHCGALPEKG